MKLPKIYFLFIIFQHESIYLKNKCVLMYVLQIYVCMFMCLCVLAWSWIGACRLNWRRFTDGMSWTPALRKGGRAVFTLCTCSLLCLAAYAVCHVSLLLVTLNSSLSDAFTSTSPHTNLLCQVHEGCPALPWPHCVLLPFSQALWSHPRETTVRGELVHREQ